MGEHTQTQEAAASPDPVRELIRTLPGVVYRCALDADWTMELISDEIEVLTGYTSDAFVGNRDLTFASVIHDDDRTRVATEITQQLEQGDDFACEYRVSHADGSQIWILERGRRVRSANGGQVLDGLLFDITARKTAQEQLRTTVAEQAVDQALAEERLHLARELHDAVGHALSVITLQAGAAHAPGLEGQIAGALNVISDVANDALAEMDRLLHALHHDGQERDPLGLQEVGRLVQRVRAAGVPVQLTVEGAPVPVDQVNDRVAYRVVQEGLTNALKHAHGAPVSLRLAHSPTEITIEVTDTGGANVGPVRTSGGRGLAGLRVRVEGLGGRLVACPRTPKGFRLQAVLPRRAG